MLVCKKYFWVITMVGKEVQGKFMAVENLLLKTVREDRKFCGHSSPACFSLCSRVLIQTQFPLMQVLSKLRLEKQISVLGCYSVLHIICGWKPDKYPYFLSLFGSNKFFKCCLCSFFLCGQCFHSP